ncbi:unnamed protein product [Trifolium pratense]|uniref:Uncharacterized protein n=1 Tax=Trifolium pratense TaxID=57577 RepID=A0ACB0LKI0_TRIPR|nr:unnamed protein product [Trifolium pratense]
MVPLIRGMKTSNVPLENPFSAVEFHTSSQNAADVYKPTSDIKLSQASKSFSRQVMKILCSHPNGISIGDLRAELTKCDLPLVKRFYGNKKFSNFLVSISHVQLQYLGGDNFWVCLVPSTKSAVKNKQSNGAATQKLHNEGKNLDRSADGIPRISSSCVSSDGEISSVDVNPEILEKKNPSQNLSTCNDCTMFKSKHEIPARKEVDEVCRSPFTSTFYSWISSWGTFWKSNAKSEVDQSPSHVEEKPHRDNFKYRVSVWWDFDSCGVPSDINFFNVAPSIMGVLRANGIKGPIHIDAYGDVSQLSQIKQEALFLSGIDLHHIPGGKNKNKWFVHWLSQTPSPRHLFLISGDIDFDFSNILYRNYARRNDNLLLAYPGKTDGYVWKDATIVWQWSSVLKGKYLTGKYCRFPPRWYFKARMQVPLEYPPEWYRNWKVPHENPSSAAEEPTSSQNAEIHVPFSYLDLFVDEDQELDSREVKEVFSLISIQIREVLSSYPNGISIGDLHYQNSIGILCIKMFSKIIASLPHVQLLYIGDDNFCVRLIPSTTSNVKKKKQRDVNHSEIPVLFSTGSFGDDVESFVFSSRGSRLISRSRSREDLAHRLQRHGPTFFMSLSENEILQLVELLIAKLKWLQESPSEVFPFVLTQSIRQNVLVMQELIDIDGKLSWRTLGIIDLPLSK